LYIYLVKKIIYLLSIALAVQLFGTLISSCNECNSGPINTRLKSISPLFKKIISNQTSNGYSYYNTSSYLPDSVGIRFDSIGIDILTEVESYAKLNFNVFINSAHACDPAVNYSKIREIYLSSDQAYDQLHPVGSNLKDLINIREGYVIGENYYTEIYGDNLFLNFNSSPTSTKSHTLTIKIILEDGRTFSSILPSIKIRNI
jgi:hypothetical protein